MNNSVPARTTRSVPVTGRLVSLHDGREYPFVVSPFVMGRDPGAAVVIGSPDAERRHAEIVSTPGGEVVVDHSAVGTYVNGRRIEGRLDLKPLDVIRVGAEEFRYYPSVVADLEGPPPGAAFRLADTLVGFPVFHAPPSRRPLATMLVKTGAARGERLAIRQPVVSIGRGEFNEVMLADSSVSVRHARLGLRGGVWTLTDLASTNGTVVDGVPVTDEVALSPGATVTFGDVSVSFEPLDDLAVAETQAADATVAAPVPDPDPDPPAVLPAEATAPSVDPVEPPVLPESSGSPEPVAAAPVVNDRESPSEGRGSPAILAGSIVVLLGALAALVYLV